MKQLSAKVTKISHYVFCKSEHLVVLTENEKKAGKAAQKGREKNSLKWDVRDGKQGLEDIRSLVSLARAILTALWQERDGRSISKTTTALITQV